MIFKIWVANMNRTQMKEREEREERGREREESGKREMTKSNVGIYCLLVNPNLKIRSSFENLIHNASNHRILEEIQNFEENTAGKQY